MIALTCLLITLTYPTTLLSYISGEPKRTQQQGLPYDKIHAPLSLSLCLSLALSLSLSLSLCLSLSLSLSHFLS
jgi:hypothetical protein